MEGPWGVFFQIRSKKSFKTRPSSSYGEETSIYLLLQQEVYGVDQELEFTQFEKLSAKESIREPFKSLENKADKKKYSLWNFIFHFYRIQNRTKKSKMDN